MCCAPLTLHTKTAIYVAELMTGVRHQWVVAHREDVRQLILLTLCGVTLNHYLAHRVSCDCMWLQGADL